MFCFLLLLCNPGSSTDAGIVHVIYGSSSGLGKNQVNANHIIAQGTNALDDISEPDDKYAESLSSADFNGDGSADLAVGVPGEDTPLGVLACGPIVVSGQPCNVGAVHVIYGSTDGLKQPFICAFLSPVNCDQFWTQKIHLSYREILQKGETVWAWPG
jgi:FG-GAP repeat